MRSVASFARCSGTALLTAILSSACASPAPDSAISLRNGDFLVEGTIITLSDGVARNEDGSFHLQDHRLGDMNADGRDDLFALLVLNSRGSGTFYYINVKLGDADGGWILVGDDFLGDRIRIEFMEIYGQGSISPVTGLSIPEEDWGQARIGFRIHARDQSFAEEPKLAVTRGWRVANGSLVRLGQD